jgi:hypothetical protein
MTSSRIEPATLPLVHSTSTTTSLRIIDNCLIICRLRFQLEKLYIARSHRNISVWPTMKGICYLVLGHDRSVWPRGSRFSTCCYRRLKGSFKPDSALHRASTSTWDTHRNLRHRACGHFEMWPVVKGIVHPCSRNMNQNTHRATISHGRCWRCRRYFTKGTRLIISPTGNSSRMSSLALTMFCLLLCKIIIHTV